MFGPIGNRTQKLVTYGNLVPYLVPGYPKTWLRFSDVKREFAPKIPPNRQEEEANWNFAVTLPDRGDEIDKTTVKGSQFQKPYLEFSLLATI